MENRSGASPDLFWIVHPLTRSRVIPTVVILFLFLLCVLVYHIYGLFMAILSIGILFGSLSSYFFPTKYLLYPDRIEVHTFARKYSRSWSYFKSFHTDKNGVLLSPFEGRSRLERFRGIYVMFNGHRDEALRYIEDKIQRG